MGAGDGDEEGDADGLVQGRVTRLEAAAAWWRQRRRGWRRRMWQAEEGVGGRETSGEGDRGDRGRR